MFCSITNFFAKRKLAKQLGKLLTPEGVQEVLNGRPPDATKIRAGRIEFIFVFIRADNPDQLNERLDVVGDAAGEHDAVIHDIVGPMVVMAFGTLRDPQPAGSRQRLVSRLQERIGADIKMVHGAADGHWGNFGKKTFSFTFTFPRFDHVLALLGRLEFGQTEEFTP